MNEGKYQPSPEKIKERIQQAGRPLTREEVEKKTKRAEEQLAGHPDRERLIALKEILGLPAYADSQDIEMKEKVIREMLPGFTSSDPESLKRYLDRLRKLYNLPENAGASDVVAHCRAERAKERSERMRKEGSIY